MAGTCESNSDGHFQNEGVNNEGYLQRHSRQMFQEGRSFSGNERDKLFRNRGDGTFADVSDLSGCDSPNDGRGVIHADLDDDGDVDLFVHENQRERHALYRNELGGNSIKVRLRATTGQYEAIGATVVVETDTTCAQVMTRGAGFESCQPPELVFGMGASESARVTVHWPGGATQTFEGVPTGGRVLLVEGQEQPEAVARASRPLPDPLPRGLHVRLGDPIVPFVTRGADGEPVTVDVRELADGKTLYLNFWATFCSSCLAEMPDLSKLHDEDESIVVAGVAMDPPGDTPEADAKVLAKVFRVFEKRGGTFPTFAHTPDAGPDAITVEAIVDLQRLPIPTTLVIDAEGVVRDIIRGPIEVD